MGSDYFFTFNYQNWTLAATLEIMLELLENKKNVTWVDMTGRLAKSHEFPIADRLHYKIIRNRIRKSGLINKSNLVYKNKFKSIYMNKDIAKNSRVQKIASEVAYLELIAMVREAEPSKEEYKLKLKQYQETYLRVYFETIKILENEKIEKVYLYNGRFLQERAVWDACIFLGITVVFFEKFHPNWIDRYFLFEKPTHSPEYRGSVMQDFGERLEKENPQLFLEAGSKWFENRILGKTQDFTSKQISENTFSFKRPYVVFFHSSEDELITTDLVSQAWGNQISALLALVEVLDAEDRYCLIIRAHPNLLHKSPREIAIWRNLGKELESKYEWVRFVNPESSINSYGLVKGSEFVVTVGSTLAVEAAYLRKKSILLGRSLHESMGITLNPEDRDDLVTFIRMDLRDQDLQLRYRRSLFYATFNEFGGSKFSRLECKDGKRGPFYTHDNFLIQHSLYVSLFMRLDTALRKVILIWR